MLPIQNILVGVNRITFLTFFRFNRQKTLQLNAMHVIAWWGRRSNLSCLKSVEEVTDITIPGEKIQRMLNDSDPKQAKLFGSMAGNLKDKEAYQRLNYLHQVWNYSGRCISSHKTHEMLLSNAILTFHRLRIVFCLKTPAMWNWLVFTALPKGLSQNV